MKIKVSEIFYSLQGEGLFMGTPSIFLRTFGCNFTCGGFSMPRGQVSAERNNINPNDYQRYEEVPLVSTGCDSFPSWDPRFKKLSPTLGINEIVERIRAALPFVDGRFANVHLVITGGEPLLGWQQAYPELLDRCLELGLKNLTFETNGTKELSPEFFNYLWGRRLQNRLPVTFSVSSKLPSSGEAWEDAIKPEVVRQYSMFDAYFKWVVFCTTDLNHVLQAKKEYQDAGVTIPIYLMPAGGTSEHYNKNQQWVAELCKQYGFRYSPRLQIDLWGNKWST